MSEIEIIQKISAGAFGTVYLANYQNKSVAVKQFYLSEKDRKKAQREISIHQLFKDHPNIVAFYNIEVKDQLCSIIMEYCQYDLQQFIQNSFYPLSHRKIKKIAYMILRGIEAIHDQEIVHRDLKPSNIMIANGQVKIGDFGSAEYLSKRQEKGQYSVEGFSKWYMAPEMLFGQRDYGQTVDIWSFGCIYAEVLLGLPLFPGMGEIDQILLISQKIGSPTPENWPDVEKMPDYGKIKQNNKFNLFEQSFKKQKRVDFQQIFKLANSEEMELLKLTLKYQNRSNVKDLLKNKYFDEMKEQDSANIKIKCEMHKQKEGFNQFFNYGNLVK